MEVFKQLSLFDILDQIETITYSTHAGFKFTYKNGKMFECVDDHGRYIMKEGVFVDD